MSVFFISVFIFAWLTNDYQVGHTATQPCENSTASSPTSRRKLIGGSPEELNQFYTEASNLS